MIPHLPLWRRIWLRWRFHAHPGGPARKAVWFMAQDFRRFLVWAGWLQEAQVIAAWVDGGAYIVIDLPTGETLHINLSEKEMKFLAEQDRRHTRKRPRSAVVRTPTLRQPK